MAALWPYMKQVVSLCPGRHSKEMLMSEACKPDHKSDKALVACTNEVHKKGES